MLEHLLQPADGIGGGEVRGIDDLDLSQAGLRFELRKEWQVAPVIIELGQDEPGRLEGQKSFPIVAGPMPLGRFHPVGVNPPEVLVARRFIEIG